MKNIKKFLINIILAITAIGISFGFGIYLGSIYYDKNNILEIEEEVLLGQDRLVDGDGVLGVEENPPIEEKIREDKRRINILAAGDIMFHMPQVNAAFNRSTRTYDFNQNFKYISEYVKKSDLALVNYETVAGGDGLGFKGYPSFNSPVSSLDAIKTAGFHVLSTANNHIFDQGKKGLISTMDNIEKRGMDYIGTSKEPGRKNLIKEIDGIKVGLLSYTYGINGREPILYKNDLEYMVNLISEHRIEADIKDLKEKEVDLIVTFIHWGEEYKRLPNERQKLLADKIFSLGGDIIFGSHPHVVQRAELKDDKFVIYSMGNFLSNQREENLGNVYTEDGIMVDVEVEKDFINNKVRIKDVKYIPTWTYKYYNDSRMNYEILPISYIIDGDVWVYNRSGILEKMERSFKRTMETVTS